MREILFRGKNINDELVIGNLFISGEHFYIAKQRAGYDLDDVDFGLAFVEVDPSTVGQYTGLKDRNGKMIFEGDIVHVDNYDEGWDSTVAFKGGAFAIDVEGMDYDYTAIGWVEYEMEIIGNIHDHMEE